MKLTLLRHGETDGSRRDLYYGAADIPALPESLAALHENAAAYPRAARYYTSGLLRTEQTLQALYGDVPHVQLPGLQMCIRDRTDTVSPTCAGGDAPACRAETAAPQCRTST